jgi:S1-C subfamily serine protease
VNLPVNAVDAATLVAALLFGVLGWRSGALPQVLGLVGIGLGIAVVVVGAPVVVRLLGDVDPFVRAVVAVAAALFVVTMAEALGSSIGLLVRQRIGRGIAGAFDSSLGAMFGVVQALLLAWLVGGLLATGPWPLLAREAQRSAAVRGLTTILPAPGEIAGDLSTIINASGLPQAFSGLEPAPAEPVDTPGIAEARQIAAAARRSTVRIDASACGRQYTGTGFAVAPGYFLTNAHVVAGSTDIRVTADVSGAAADGIISLFDPELDIAVIRTPGLALPALTFAKASPERGATGAALGHPNAAPLAIVPAGVTANLHARGRDIYDSQVVVRNVLELRAAVEPGDSGGPLILADGTVGGLIFAESRTDPEVGYALDPLDVLAAAIPGIGKTKAADPGACIR